MSTNPVPVSELGLTTERAPTEIIVHCTGKISLLPFLRKYLWVLRHQRGLCERVDIPQLLVRLF
jgi:hypothetical protein